MQWHEIDINTIIGGIAPDGVLYLKKFLIDYKKEFNVEQVNPSCTTCLKSYHQKFINKYNKMENSKNYILHKKREGLPLEFGSSVKVNNENITDEYAQKLIERYSKKEGFTLDYLFSKYPKETTKKVVEEETTQFEAPKKSRKKRR